MFIKSFFGEFCMNRTKLVDRHLPVYTKGEELTNMITHICGGALGVAALVLCVVFSALHRNPWGVVGCTLYGASLILVYTASSIYHGLRPGMAKKVFQVLDHCVIYFLIGGTYTPILFCSIRPSRLGLDHFWNCLGACRNGYRLYGH